MGIPWESSGLETAWHPGSIPSQGTKTPHIAKKKKERERET